MTKLLANERIDDLNINGYKIIQNTKEFCFGMDAVLLSSFAKVKKGQTVVDLCTGTGVIPILLAAKTDASRLFGIEIQEACANMASRSIGLNNLDDKINIINGDINKAKSLLGNMQVNVVTCNPPYMNDMHGIKNPSLPKAIARHEIYCNLEDVVRVSSQLLKVSGSLFMVHRPFRLVEIISTMAKYKLEPKRIRLVYPYIDREPNMVLIEAVKGGKSMIKVDPPLIVYKEINKYTDEIYDIYGYERDGR